MPFFVVAIRTVNGSFIVPVYDLVSTIGAWLLIEPAWNALHTLDGRLVRVIGQTVLGMTSAISKPEQLGPLFAAASYMFTEVPT